MMMTELISSEPVTVNEYGGLAGGFFEDTWGDIVGEAKDTINKEIDKAQGQGEEKLKEKIEEGVQTVNNALDTPAGETPTMTDKLKNVWDKTPFYVVGGGAFAVSKLAFGLGMITSSLIGVAGAGAKLYMDNENKKKASGQTALSDCNCYKY